MISYIVMRFWEVLCGPQKCSCHLSGWQGCQTRPVPMKILMWLESTGFKGVLRKLWMMYCIGNMRKPSFCWILLGSSLKVSCLERSLKKKILLGEYQGILTWLRHCPKDEEVFGGLDLLQRLTFPIDFHIFQRGGSTTNQFITFLTKEFSNCRVFQMLLRWSWPMSPLRCDALLHPGEHWGACYVRYVGKTGDYTV